jgi:hypothetical protein
MKSLLIGKDGRSIEGAFARGALGEMGRRTERWLQDMIFAHPDLLPLEDIDPAAA